MTFLQLRAQDLLGETCIGHADDMAFPSKLVLHYYSGDDGHVGFLQDSGFLPSVLPADPQDLS